MTMVTPTISQRREYIANGLPTEIVGKHVVLWDDGDDYERGTTVIVGIYGPIPDGVTPELLVEFLVDRDCEFAVLDLVPLLLQKKDVLTWKR